MLPRMQWWEKCINNLWPLHSKSRSSSLSKFTSSSCCEHKFQEPLLVMIDTGLRVARWRPRAAAWARWLGPASKWAYVRMQSTWYIPQGSCCEKALRSVSRPQQGTIKTFKIFKTYTHWLCNDNVQLPIAPRGRPGTLREPEDIRTFQ